ncbi:MAG: DUF86 domain-containing protein [Flavobacteriaceae bacterium]|nr:DUF86 domain-containing protein [Flavobacteriaceae bacterium]MCY4217022.1 DUF86 domain-containing protein [Flavobacteriaceae bacterium]MCY4253679.1 DUF86 domain-containing protein [Flavobacteriaceae bacterium]
MTEKKRENILSHCDLIEASIQEFYELTHSIDSMDILYQNRKEKLVVERLINNICEGIHTIYKIHPHIENEYPLIEWSKTIGLRIILTHYYFKINNQKLWNAMTNSIPKLEKQIPGLRKFIENDQTRSKDYSTTR